MGVIVKFSLFHFFSACHTLMLLGILSYREYHTLQIKWDFIPAQNLVLFSLSKFVPCNFQRGDQMQDLFVACGENVAVSQQMQFQNEICILVANEKKNANTHMWKRDYNSSNSRQAGSPQGQTVQCSEIVKNPRATS